MTSFFKRIKLSKENSGGSKHRIRLPDGRALNLRFNVFTSEEKALNVTISKLELTEDGKYFMLSQVDNEAALIPACSPPNPSCLCSPIARRFFLCFWSINSIMKSVQLDDPSLLHAVQKIHDFVLSNRNGLQQSVEETAELSMMLESEETVNRLLLSLLSSSELTSTWTRVKDKAGKTYLLGVTYSSLLVRREFEDNLMDTYSWANLGHPYSRKHTIQIPLLTPTPSTPTPTYLLQLKSGSHKHTGKRWHSVPPLSTGDGASSLDSKAEKQTKLVFCLQDSVTTNRLVRQLVAVQTLSLGKDTAVTTKPSTFTSGSSSLSRLSRRFRDTFRVSIRPFSKRTPKAGEETNVTPEDQIRLPVITDVSADQPVVTKETHLPAVEEVITPQPTNASRLALSSSTFLLDKPVATAPSTTLVLKSQPQWEPGVGIKDIVEAAAGEAEAELDECEARLLNSIVNAKSTVMPRAPEPTRYSSQLGEQGSPPKLSSFGGRSTEATTPTKPSSLLCSLGTSPTVCSSPGYGNTPSGASKEDVIKPLPSPPSPAVVSGPVSASPVSMQEALTASIPTTNVSMEWFSASTTGDTVEAIKTPSPAVAVSTATTPRTTVSAAFSVPPSAASTNVEQTEPSSPLPPQTICKPSTTETTAVVPTKSILNSTQLEAHGSDSLSLGMARVEMIRVAEELRAAVESQESQLHTCSVERPTAVKEITVTPIAATAEVEKSSTMSHQLAPGGDTAESSFLVNGIYNTVAAKFDGGDGEAIEPLPPPPPSSLLTVGETVKIEGLRTSTTPSTPLDSANKPAPKSMIAPPVVVPPSRIQAPVIGVKRTDSHDAVSLATSSDNGHSATLTASSHSASAIQPPRILSNSARHSVTNQVTSPGGKQSVESNQATTPAQPSPSTRHSGIRPPSIMPPSSGSPDRSRAGHSSSADDTDGVPLTDEPSQKESSTSSRESGITPPKPVTSLRSGIAPPSVHVSSKTRVSHPTPTATSGVGGASLSPQGSTTAAPPPTGTTGIRMPSRLPKQAIAK